MGTRYNIIDLRTHLRRKLLQVRSPCLPRLDLLRSENHLQRKGSDANESLVRLRRQYIRYMMITSHAAVWINLVYLIHQFIFASYDGRNLEAFQGITTGRALVCLAVSPTAPPVRFESFWALKTPWLLNQSFCVLLCAVSCNLHPRASLNGSILDRCRAIHWLQLAIKTAVLFWCVTSYSWKYQSWEHSS